MRTLLSLASKTFSLFFLGLMAMSFQSDTPKLDLVEKIYAHTDRPLYFPGETIWFKAYVVNSSHTISSLSEMMYADLISPKGSVVKTVRLPVQNGYAYGNFNIDKKWVGGTYTLKMYTNWMRNYGEAHFFTKEIVVQKVVQPKLLMNLEFEKEAYGTSSEVIANFEVKDLKNSPLRDRDINVSLRIKGKSYRSQTVKTDSEGKASPKFILPNDLATSDVLMNIQIPYKGTTEAISRSVPIVLDNVDIQFFPESGQMIADGAPNHVAFKAVDAYGKPVDITGKIIDGSGNHIVDFNSFHDGMGGFDLSVSAQKKYFAVVTAPYAFEHKIPLPEVYGKGVRFSIFQTRDSVRLQLFSTVSKTLRLKVSNSSKTLLTKNIPAGDGEVVLPTNNYPMGITKFSILEENGAVLAERLVFLNQHRQLQIAVKIDKKTYNTREKVALQILTKNEKGKPIAANLSLGVVDNKLLSFANDKQDHILSYLLMSSELRGKIHEPFFYFDQEEPKAIKALDYVMLTHGWRHYITTNELSLFGAAYEPEQLAIQNGLIVDQKGNPTKAHLFLFDRYGDKVLDFDTDEAGRFSFKLSGPRSYTLVAYTDDNKALYIRPMRRHNGYSSSSERKDGIPKPNMPKGFFGVEKPIQKPLKVEARANLSLSEDAQALDEVIVTSQGSIRKQDATASLTEIVTANLETSQNVEMLLQGKVAGVQITNRNGVLGSGAQINIRGMSSLSGTNRPLYVVDGIPIEFNDEITIDTDQIASISVLRDLAATTLYGSTASNGVLLISTKNQNRSNYRKKKLNNTRYKNYVAHNFYGSASNSFDSSATFYAPIYEGERLSEERTDFRSTIYWNPVVQTDENGEATLEFYNSDALTSFKITAEGVGYNGLLGRTELDYSTKKLLNLDFKVPNYMTINDLIVLPVTFTNETDQTLFTNFELQLPENLRLAGDYEKTITIPAGTSLVKNIRVIALEKGIDLKISASVTSDTYSDVVHKTSTILASYFPVETSISGVTDQSFELPINHIVANSLRADFIVYTDIVGEMMNGVASMIRRPSGCFEQVSSTTYPNVMVLKYLRETGKNKGSIERQALKYIEDGYRRLAAYETTENGFEWYGNTPPHEALSAYGLMQFKEMSEVYEGVDQKMVARTEKWLLDRRDGKGGFLQNRGKYGFSAAPTDVNNAYIVYALSESDPSLPIMKEYKKAYDDALDSLDTYKLALTALASHNLNKLHAYDVAIKLLKKNIGDYGFAKLPVKSTITRSYGNAENLETVAFTLLALMKDFGANELLINMGVEHVLKSRRYGRFGSTQSTSMILKVLIAYHKTQKQKVIHKNDMVELQLNGKVIREKIALNETGTIRIDSLQKYLKEGNQKISVRFTNSEVSFPYSINVKWDSHLPDSSESCKVSMKTEIKSTTYKVGDVVRMKITVLNQQKTGLPMATAIVGIPSGASLQPWQLKELLEERKVDYYELFDNYLVLYWREMGPKEMKVINLDLKADIAGDYTAPASSVYLYYGDEYKNWIKGNHLKIFE